MELKTIDKNSNQNIDLIKSLSIISVVINVINNKFLPSGYLGIDIFFFLTGYLSISSLKKIKSKNSINFLEKFYLKKIRIIIPILFIYFLITSLLITMFFNSPGVIIKTGLSSLFGISNIYLNRHAYSPFSQFFQLNPFSATWAISLIIQFYFLIPLTYLLFGLKNNFINNKKKFRNFLAFAASISLVFYVFNFSSSDSSTYLLIYYRLWEFLLGSIIFLIKEEIGENKSKSVYLIFARYILLIIVFILPEGFTVLKSMLVMFLTSSIIIFSAKNFISKIIFEKYILAISKHSYSIYLCHTCIIVISNWSIGVNKYTLILQILLITLASIATKKYIETPVKRINLDDKFSSKLFKIMFISLLSIATIYFTILNRIKVNIYLPKLLGFDIKQNWNESVKDCQSPSRFYNHISPYEYCLKTQRVNNKKRFYLIGDSHAAHMYEAVAPLAKEKNYELAFINSGAPNDFPESFLNKKNAFANSKSVKKLYENAKVGDIVAISFFRGHLNQDPWNHVSIDFARKENKRLKNAKDNFYDFLNLLDKKGVKTILIRDVPMLRQNLNWKICEFQEKFFKYNNCDISVNEDTITRYKQDNLYDYLNAKIPNVKIWDPRKLMNQNGIYSWKSKEGEIIMTDQNHITNKYSKFLSKDFEKFMYKNKILESSYSPIKNKINTK